MSLTASAQFQQVNYGESINGTNLPTHREFGILAQRVSLAHDGRTRATGGE